MSSLKHVANYSTSYGVAIPAYENESDPESYLFDMPGTAIIMGIYDTDARQRYADHVTNGGNPGEFEAFGGHKPPCLKLPRPASSIYNTMPRHATAIPIGRWIDGALSHRRWSDRADFLTGVLSACTKSFNEEPTPAYMPADMREDICSIALSMMLTATLEMLPDTEIDCLEGASFYALTLHHEWRHPAQRWLRPFRKTWLRDWLAERPAYCEFAKIRRALKTSEVPVWLTGGAA